MQWCWPDVYVFQVVVVIAGILSTFDYVQNAQGLRKFWF